jgi:hypothetical protein
VGILVQGGGVGVEVEVEERGGMEGIGGVEKGREGEGRGYIVRKLGTGDRGDDIDRGRGNGCTQGTRTALPNLASRTIEFDERVIKLSTR